MDRQLLLAKKEVTYGTGVVLAAADTIMAEDVTYAPVNDNVTPNPAKPGVGAVADVPYGERVNISFKVPLAGSGAAGTAPNWGKIIKACGWGETIVASTSVTYAPLANPKGCDSLSVSWRDDRRLHLVSGFRGRAGLTLDANGRPMLVFTGIALYAEPTTGAVLAQSDADWTGWLDALVVENGTTTFTFDSISNLGIRQFSFDASDNVRFINVPGQENVDLVGERAYTGKAAITTPLMSSLNLEAIARLGTRKVFTLVHETAAGRIVTVSGRCQVRMPSYSRDRGDDVTSFDMKLVPSALNTDNELSIVLT